MTKTGLSAYLNKRRKEAGVIEQETLRFLDYLAWLGTTERVAERCVCDLSTVNRHLGKCANLFKISRHKTGGEWQLTGDLDILREERRIHQYYRWNHSARIRVDGYFYHRPLYLNLQPDHFEIGSSDLLDVSIIQDLVGDSVVDAYLVNGPNVANLDADLTCIPISIEPLELYAFPGHPLFNMSRADRSLDIAAHYPLVSYGKTILPYYYKAFGKLFHRRIPAFDTTRFCLKRILCNLAGVQDPVLPGSGTLQFAALKLKHPAIHPLGVELPIAYGDSLLVRTEYVNHPLMRKLISTIQKQVRSLMEEIPGLECALDD